MRVVVFYHRSVGGRCSSIRYRLQTRRDGLAEAYATRARVRPVRYLDNPIPSPARGVLFACRSGVPIACRLTAVEAVGPILAPGRCCATSTERHELDSLAE